MTYKTLLNYRQAPAPTAASLFNQALALHQRGQLEQARGLYQRVLQMQPRHGDSLQLMGTLCLQQSQDQAALGWFDQALAVDPANAPACNNLGLAHKNLGQLESALQAFDRAVVLQPGFVDAQFNRANVLAMLGRFDGAVLGYERAIALTPHDTQLRTAHAVALSRSGRLDAAEAAFRAIVALTPNDPSAHANLGNVLFERGELQAAQACQRQALALDPGHVNAHYNLGVLLQADGQIAAALQAYGQATRLAPEHVLAQWNLGLCQLLTGDFANGWPQYEWRWKNPNLDVFQERRDFAAPRWDGSQPLAGKTILLYSEQGLGDTIQFCRYARLVAERGARVVLEVQAPLLRLLAGLEGVAELVERGQSLPAFDFHCPLLSLPAAFQTTLATVPAAPAYLCADASLVARWKERLDAVCAPGKRKVGLVWSGRASLDNDHRSMVLQALESLCASDVQFVSLQQEVRAADVQALAARADIVHFGADLKDMADTAALIAQMDLVVSIDTGVAHLAAAMGKPVWLMLAHVPDWRWLLERTDSPWYPTMALLRQPTPGAWAPVVEAVQTRLAASGMASGR